MEKSYTLEVFIGRIVNQGDQKWSIVSDPNLQIRLPLEDKRMDLGNQMVVTSCHRNRKFYDYNFLVSYNKLLHNT